MATTARRSPHRSGQRSRAGQTSEAIRFEESPRICRERITCKTITADYADKTFCSFRSQLADNPKILALRADPQIQRMIEEGRLWQLLQDDRLIEAANDPELAKQVKQFDLKKALEYAAKE